MAVVGDLVVVSRMDTTQFAKGATEVETRINQMATKSGYAGRNAFNQFAFAAQDFASVMSIGGANALPRAFMAIGNNLQMMTANLPGSVGAWATLGTTLGALVIPKLLEGDTAFMQIAESLAHATKGLDDFVRHAAGLKNFDALIGKAKSREDMDRLTEGIGNERATKKIEVDAIGAELRKAQQQRQALVDQRNELTKGMFGNPADWVTSPAKKFVAQGLDNAIMGVDKVIGDLQGKMRSGSTDLLTIEEKRRKLEEGRQGILDREEKEKAKRLEDKNQDPFSIATKRMAEAADFAKRGLMSPESALRESQDAMKDFASTRGGKGGPLKLAEFGTSEAFSQVLDSIRESDTGDEQVQKLGEMLEEIKEQVRLLRAIKEGGPVQVGLPR